MESFRKNDSLNKKHFARFHDRVQTKYNEMQKRLDKSRSLDSISSLSDDCMFRLSVSSDVKEEDEDFEIRSEKIGKHSAIVENVNKSDAIPRNVETVEKRLSFSNGKKESVAFLKEIGSSLESLNDIVFVNKIDENVSIEPVKSQIEEASSETPLPETPPPTQRISLRDKIGTRITAALERRKEAKDAKKELRGKVEKSKGVYAVPKLVLFTSELAHYSTKKLATFMGIGGDNCILIKTDNVGKMDVKDLEAKINEAIENGATPFLVTATAGTTVFGAFDPLVSISALCKKYNLWLHVDAAWGGGALMSRKHRHFLAGIEMADSVTWNPHKLLAAPQQCSTFLIRHKKVLEEGHSSEAKYLFQKDKFYDTSYDTGDKHIQCGRRADVLKFWFMWKAKGSEGLEKHIDKLFDNAQYFLDHIRQREGFQLVLDKPQCTNIMFWYIPSCLRGRENDPDYKERLHKVAPKIKERMIKEGSMMVTYQPQGDLVNFFRIVFQNSALEHKDMVYFANEIERLGKDIEV